MSIMGPSLTGPFAAAFTLPSGITWFAHYGTIPTWVLLATWPLGTAQVGTLLGLLARGASGWELAGRASLAGRTAEWIRTVCERGGWELGEVWRVDPNAGRLRWEAGYHSPRPELARFAAKSRPRTFARAEGLPGRVWSSEQPIWVSDLRADVRFRRTRLAQRAGLRTAFVMPLRAGTEVTGVLMVFR